MGITIQKKRPMLTDSRRKPKKPKRSYSIKGGRTAEEIVTDINNRFYGRTA